MYYRACPNCGCNLDPGERCDCSEKNSQIEKERHFQKTLDSISRLKSCKPMRCEYTGTPDMFVRAE